MSSSSSEKASLWRKVADGQPFDAQRLADWLLEEYEVSREQALADSQNTIDTWLSAGIIE